jgi:predicted flavoprotein YhiN
MVLVKTQHTEVSLARPLRQTRKNRAVHVSLSQSSIVKQQIAQPKPTEHRPVTRHSAPIPQEAKKKAPLSGGAVSMGGL